MRSARYLTFIAAALLLVSVSMRTSAADSALYEKFGGRDGLVKIVDDATDRWTSDDRIKLTFDDLNLVRFKGLLVDQLCELIGGPCHYKGRNMYESHKGLHLGTAEFNALAEDLQYAMEKYDVPYGAQNQLLALLAPMEKDVVTRYRFEGSPRVGDPQPQSQP